MTKLKLPKTLYRAAQESTREGELMSISSDVPYLRYDWDGEAYYEILDHSEGSIDDARLKAGLPILFNHDRNLPLGRAAGYVNDGHKISIKLDEVKWSSSAFATEKKADIEAGVLPDTSVGYEVLSMEEGEKIDGVPSYICRWQILEGSVVTIPSDISVGAGRSLDEAASKEISIKSKNVLANSKKAPAASEKHMTETDQTEVEQPESDPVIETETPAPVPPQIDAAQERQAGVNQERERVLSIAKWANEISKLRNIDLSEAQSEHIASGKSLADFKEWVLRNEFKAAPLSTGGDQPASNEMKREKFNKLSPIEQANFCRNGGRLKD